MINNQLLQSLSVGPLRFPANPAEGVATLKIKAEYKVDVQKPHGKDDPKLSGVGKDARKVTVELAWTFRIDDETRDFLREVSPVGINAGKAWELSHPDMEIYSIDAIQFTSMGEITRDVDQMKITLEGLSWNKASAARGARADAAEAARVAAKAIKWTNPDSVAPPSKGNKVQRIPGVSYMSDADRKAAGFDSAPRAKVPS